MTRTFTQGRAAAALLALGLAVSSTRAAEAGPTPPTAPSEDPSAVSTSALEGRCRRGEPAACVELQRRGETEEAETKARAARTCDQSGVGCRLAVFGYASPGWRVPTAAELPSDAIALLTRGCEATATTDPHGYNRTCTDLAFTLVNLHGDDGIPEAIAVWDRQCVLGRAGCAEAAFLRATAGATPEIRSTGMDALRALARDGSGPALQALAVLTWGGPSGIPEELRVGWRGCFSGSALPLPRRCRPYVRALTREPRR